MPRADFYLIDKPRFREQPLLLVCELAKKAYAAELPTLILTRTLDEAEALDDLLWAFDADAPSFVPSKNTAPTRTRPTWAHIANTCACNPRNASSCV